FSIYGFVQHRVERAVEQGVNQRGWRVVAAGGLAFVASGRRQSEGAGGQVDLRVKFEQALVNAAEFFRSEVLVVDAAVALHFVVVPTSKRPHRIEQMAVADAAVDQVGSRSIAEQKRT